MSVIETRYRDIPWEELRQAHKPERAMADHPEWWAKLRGKPVTIETPPLDAPASAECNEPHYRLAEGHPFISGRGAIVCCHCVEIGD